MAKKYTLNDLINKQDNLLKDLDSKGKLEEDTVILFNADSDAFEMLEDDGGIGHELTMGYKRYLLEEAKNESANDQDDYSSYDDDYEEY